MPRLSLSILFLACLLLTGVAQGQVAPASASASVTCNFDDDHQLVVNYERIAFNLKKAIFGRDLQYGKVWAPGHKPLTLLTNTPVEIGGKTLLLGGYTMFVLPNPKQWMLIISKSTDTSGKYDEQQDIVRIPMESGELPSPEPVFSVSFAHVAPDQCNIRLDLDKSGNFVTFQKR